MYAVEVGTTLRFDSGDLDIELGPSERRIRALRTVEVTKLLILECSAD
jgi:hypothetical protein